MAIFSSHKRAGFPPREGILAMPSMIAEPDIGAECI
jgi:hypothetical protein